MVPFKITKEIKSALDTGDLKDIKRELCGPLLSHGRGNNRKVYDLKGFPDHVIKIEHRMHRGIFANVGEFRNWMDYQDWDYLAPWLAPVEMISHDGQILIQRKVQQDRKRKDYPTYIPAVFTDLKLDNFGWLEDRFVCCDYSFLILIIGKGERPMKHAKWRGSIKNLLR